MSLAVNETYHRLHQQVIAGRGPWQQTATGQGFFIGDPRPEEVEVFDIAQSLSMQCRYNGHVKVKRHYSVAQHAFHVSKWMEEDGFNLEYCFAGLHHDSAEAYTGDIVSQVKFLVPEFRAVEDKVESAVFEAFGIKLTPVMELTIKEYDLIALATEKRDILPPNRTEYSWGDLPEPRVPPLDYWSADQARCAFLTRHHELITKLKRTAA